MVQFSKINPRSQKLKLAHAELLAKKGDFAAACRIYGGLFASGCTDETTLRHYVEICIELKSYDEAIAAVGGVMLRRPTLVVQRWMAGLYGLKGDQAKSIAMFEDLQGRYPNDLGVAIDLAAAYDQDKQYDKALASPNG